MIWLAQTDTTAGFLSHDQAALNRLKGRDEAQKCLVCVDSFLKASEFVRFEKAFFNRVRRAKRTTFLCNSRALRVCKDARHTAFLRENLQGWAFSTSANRHGEDFDEAWARQAADAVEAGVEFSQRQNSAMFKLGKRRIVRLR